MTTLNKKRAAGGGRKALPPELKTFSTSIRLTEEQNAKFMALGGAEWLRKSLNAMHINTTNNEAAQ